MVRCLFVWGSAMIGLDAVDEALGYVGPVFGPACSHPSAVAVELPATVVWGMDGRDPGLESDSTSSGCKGSALVHHPTRMSRSSSRRSGLEFPHT